jgi:hypothetical protein
MVLEVGLEMELKKHLLFPRRFLALIKGELYKSL